LRHDDRIGQGHKHAIADEKSAGACRRMRREWPHHRSRAAPNGVEQPGVNGRKAMLAARPRDRPGSTAGGEGPFMRGRVDADRPARNNDRPCPSEGRREVTRERLGVRVGIAGSDDGDGA
jgi:hypothetical protein